MPYMLLVNSPLSYDNFSFYNQKNTGNNTLAQYDGDGKDINSAKQSIRQSQSSTQNSQIVSGENAIGSQNNINAQNQVNRK